MTKLKFTKKLKSSIMALFVAVIMLLGANYGCIYSSLLYASTHYSSVASAVYKATDYKSYFTTSSTTDVTPNNPSANSDKYYMNRNADLVGLTLDNNIYPIVKYNGITTIKSERENIDNLSEVDKADNYAALITTNGYPAATNTYKQDTSGNYVYESYTYKDSVDGKEQEETANVVYVYPTNKTSTEFEANLENLKNVVAAINSSMTFTNNVKYVVADNTASKFTTISSSALTELYADFTTYVDSEEYNFNTDLYTFKYCRIDNYTENKLYIATSTSSVSLTNNSYYCVSCWVYTAGDATASIVISGTNLKAKVENISTGGVWVKYFLFIETRATTSTSCYIYLYYGDEDGVTGTQKDLDSYKNNSDAASDAAEYSQNTITGTVIFDNLTIQTINEGEYLNQTVNGYSAQDIAKASISSSIEDITTIQNSTYARPITESDGETETITGYNYTYATYSKNSSDELCSVSTYTARNYKDNLFYKFADNTTQYDFSQSFDYASNINLVYNNDTSTSLSFDTYKSNTSSPLSYYVPRYTTDSGTTDLSTDQKKMYRNIYSGGNLSASIVDEVEAFEAYDADLYDALGNKVELEDGQENKVHNNTFGIGNSNSILKLQNNNQTYDLGVVTTGFKVAALSYYRVSVWAYSEDSSATATVKLFSTIYTRDTSTNGTLILTTATSTDFEYNGNSTNGWQEIVFYVQGNPYESKDVYIALLASADSTVYYDNIKIEAVSSSSYTSGTNTLNLASTGVVTSNVTNGLFNSITVTDEYDSTSYPYTAASWTLDSDNTDGIISGVVPTDERYNNMYVPAYKDGELYYCDEEIVEHNGQLFWATDTSFTTPLEYGKDYFVDYSGSYIRGTTIDTMLGVKDAPTSKASDLPEFSNVQRAATNVYAVKLPTATDSEDKATFLMKSSNLGSSSSSSTLSANAVYKLTFQAWFSTDFDGTFVANLQLNSKTISTIELKIDKADQDTVTKQTWQTFTFYIRTGNTSRTTVSLQLGATESSGTFFIQDVNNVALASKTDSATNETLSVDDQYQSLLSGASTIENQNEITNGNVNIVRFVDMQSNNFTMHSQNVNEDTGIYDSYSYTQDDASSDSAYTNGTLGVVDPSTSFSYNGTSVAVSKKDDSVTDTYLLLKNDKVKNSEGEYTDDVTDYTVATAKFSTTLSSSKYYKVTFAVKTSGDMGTKGLNVTANGISETFENLNNSDWQTYTIYVRTGSSSISSFSLKFELGESDGTSFAGWALVSDIDISAIDEDVYNEETESEEVTAAVANNTAIIKNLYVETTSSDSSDDDSNVNVFSWTNFFYIFSSMLLFIALVIAIVTFFVKKKLKKSSASSKSSDTQLGGQASADTPTDGGIQ